MYAFLPLFYTTCTFRTQIPKARKIVLSIQYSDTTLLFSLYVLRIHGTAMPLLTVHISPQQHQVATNWPRTALFWKPPRFVFSPGGRLRPSAMGGLVGVVFGCVSTAFGGSCAMCSGVCVANFLEGHISRDQLFSLKKEKISWAGPIGRNPLSCSCSIGPNFPTISHSLGCLHTVCWLYYPVKLQQRFTG